MGWDFAIYGEIIFPKNGIEKWLILDVVPEEYKPEAWPFTDPIDESFNPPLTVIDVLKLFKAKDLHIFKKGNKVTYRGWMDKDTMADFGNLLAASYRNASKVDGTGELYLIAVGNTLNFKFTLKNGRSYYKEPEEDLERSPMVDEILAYPFEKKKNEW